LDSFHTSARAGIAHEVHELPFHLSTLADFEFGASMIQASLPDALPSAMLASPSGSCDADTLAAAQVRPVQRRTTKPVAAPAESRSVHADHAVPAPVTENLVSQLPPAVVVPVVVTTRQPGVLAPLAGAAARLSGSAAAPASARPWQATLARIPTSGLAPG
jgi:hypothetical protein